MKYNVIVLRTSYAEAQVKVEADSAEEASRLALDGAEGNGPVLEFCETDADYDVAHLAPVLPPEELVDPK